MRTHKQELQARFKELYPSKRLLAIQLNGFNHTVFFDGGHESDPVTVERYSPYSEVSSQSKQSKALFEGYPTYTYQNNAVEYVYILPEER